MAIRMVEAPRPQPASATSAPRLYEQVAVGEISANRDFGTGARKAGGSATFGEQLLVGEHFARAIRKQFINAVLGLAALEEGRRSTRPVAI